MTGKAHLGKTEFDSLVSQAVSRIPAEISRYLDNIVISVQPRPGRELLEDLGLHPDDHLFGVYIGIPLSERSAAEPPLYPDTIRIFQEELESVCSTREEIIEEIEITVVHEIAHFVGFSDDELAEFGYG